MIRIEGTRFGTIEISEESVIRFPAGLVGFKEETEFALLERAKGGAIAYLQSLKSPALAFPVTDGGLFGADYPSPNAAELAPTVGLDSGDLITLVIVAVNPESHAMVANQLAPLIIDATRREGAQVVLDPRQYSASAPIAALPSGEAESTEETTSTGEAMTAEADTATEFTDNENQGTEEQELTRIAV